MKRRNEFEVMGRLIGLVKPLAGYMALSVLGFDTPLGVTALFALIMCGFIGSFHWTLGLLPWAPTSQWGCFCPWQCPGSAEAAGKSSAPSSVI